MQCIIRAVMQCISRAVMQCIIRAVMHHQSCDASSELCCIIRAVIRAVLESLMEPQPQPHHTRCAQPPHPQCPSTTPA
eukprot:7160885-Prymnesium_polylepis.1